MTQDIMTQEFVIVHCSLKEFNDNLKRLRTLRLSITMI